MFHLASWDLCVLAFALIALPFVFFPGLFLSFPSLFVYFLCILCFNFLFAPFGSVSSRCFPFRFFCFIPWFLSFALLCPFVAALPLLFLSFPCLCVAHVVRSPFIFLYVRWCSSSSVMFVSFCVFPSPCCLMFCCVPICYVLSLSCLVFLSLSVTAINLFSLPVAICCCFV